MSQVRGTGWVRVLAISGLVLAAAACGKPPAKSDTGPSAAPGGSGPRAHACMVTDTGGINDRSFNASAWAGLQAAGTQNGNITSEFTQSTSEADYTPNLTAYAQKKCDLIVAVGGLMAKTTTAAAKAYPNKKFAIIDASIPLPNVYSMQFNTAQAAFLSGYLAAGYSKTGKVATYGGLKIPPVTIFMDGFADGVAHYNQAKGKNVQVLGWNKATQNGSFVPGQNPFTDQNAGRQLSDAFVAQGADVVLPVAGGTGLGTASAAAQSHGRFSVIWVDQDGCSSASQYCGVFLSTVLKNISDTVRDVVLKLAAGTLPGSGGSIGTLANSGVQLAPYHQFDGKVPDDLKSEIDKLKQDIIAGKVSVTSPAAPR